MATHDYVIDNSTGANVRADINSVLQAILTNNSSSSAPSTTAAYMFWADTTTGTLKIRNSSDNAWVELLQLDGTLTLEDGSASTPGLAFRDDLNTGIFSSAADKFNVATGGVERMELGGTTIFNETGADVDFRIESDNKANMFYLDAGNDRIGFGLSSPLSFAHFQRNSAGSVSAGNETVLSLENNNSCILQFFSPSANVNQIRFGDPADNGAGFIEYNHNGDKFSIGVGGPTKLTLDSSGRLGLGTTSPTQLLEINGASNPAVLIKDTTNDVISYIFAENDHGTVGTASSHPFVFNINNGEKMRLTSNGELLIGKDSTSQTYTLQVQSDSNANGIAIYGRSGDDIAEIGWYENDGTTKLGELQYRQDHFAIRHRVGHIEFATTYSGNSVSERMRVFEDKLCIGTTAGVGLATSRRLQIRGTNHANVGMNILITANDSNPASIDLGKSRSSGNAILGNNDDVGQINFYGNDGSGFHSMARILCRCQGHDTSDNDLPAALVFSTLTENTTSLKERLIIDDEGIVSTCSQNHAFSVATTVSAGTNKYNFRGHHSGTNGQPGSGTISFTVWSNGNVENTNNSYGQISDETLKQDIVDASSQWNDIKNITVRKFRFKDNPTGELQIGVVAQEVEKVSAGLVYETGDVGEEVKAVKYSVLYMKAIKALQEAITKIEVLETKVAALEAA